MTMMLSVFSDFVFMVEKTSKMFINSPDAIKGNANNNNLFNNNYNIHIYHLF